MLKQGTNCKFYENRARGTPLRGVYIPHFDQISLKNQFWGSYTTLTVAPMGWNLARTRGPSSVPNFTPHWCNLSPLWGEKPQNQPLSKSDTGALLFSQYCQ